MFTGSISKLGIGGVRPPVTCLIISLSFKRLVIECKSGPTNPLAVIPWHPTQFILKRASPSSAEPFSSRVLIIYLLFSLWFTKKIEKNAIKNKKKIKKIVKKIF